MRDIAVAIPLFIIIAMAFVRPRIGAYGWTWFSIANPHTLTYGFARSLPWGQGLAIATLVGLLFTKERKPFPWTPITKLYVAFVVWMTITSFFAIASQSLVWDQWKFVMKIHVMIFATMMLIRGRQQIETLVWVLVLSLAFYGVKAGVWVLLTGGSNRVYGPGGGLLGSNNEFAIGLILIIPLVYFLYTIAKHKAIRWAMLATVPLCFIAVLGSHSRGALLGLVAMALFMIIRNSKSVPRTIVALVAGAIGLAILISFMPDSWTERMQTIQSYQDDGSAMGRIQIWGMIWEMVKNNPVMGGGFRLDNPIFYGMYAPMGFENALLGPHSIYFQALGEHGFPGLLMFLGLGVLTWRTGNQIIARCKNNPDNKWADTLARMIQVSFLGFAVSGAFGAMTHLDLAYYLIATMILMDIATQRQSS